MVRLFISLCLFGLVSSCASPGHFTPVSLDSPDDAILYIYRPRANNPGAQPLRRSYPEMILDGKSIGMMKFKNYKYIKIKPGSHELTATGLTEGSKWKPRDLNLKFKIQSGETKYIKLNVQYNMKDMHVIESGPQYSIFLTPMNANTAIYEIRETNPE